jgi:hypothetical protein
MNIQYVRLDDRVCEILNRMAREQRRTVSELVNEILGQRLKEIAGNPAAEGAGGL